jgi:hypothetical protein
MTGTKLCDRCYELESRIQDDPAIARKVLAAMDGVNGAHMVLATVFEGLRCQEASIHSRETYIPCGAPAAAVIWHQNDGHHTYLMCAACAFHNVKNRRGRLVVTSDPVAIP